MGLVGLINAVDAMLKAANVELASPVIKLDGGLVSVMIRGDVSSVRAAVEAGAEAAGRIGELKAAHVIPRPGEAVVRAFAGRRRGEDPRRQPRQHQLQVPPLRPRRPGRAAAARGAVERIGSDDAKVSIRSPRGEVERVEPVADHGDAVQLCLDQLTDPQLGVLADGRRRRGDRLQGGPRPGPDRRAPRRRARCSQAMEAFADVAPAHNPPYVKAMRMLAARFPDLPLVAAFETGFHRDDPRGATSATPSPTTGRPSSASAAGASTAPATATSPAGWPSCSAATT